MADDVVGSVKVRIRPDTSRFAEETKDGVEKAVDKVNRQAKNNKDLKVQLHSTLDTRAIKSDALQGLREINAELRTNDKYKVQFRAQISKTGMQKTVREARKHLQLLADAQKAVDFKATLSETELTKVRESIKKLGSQIESDLEDAQTLKFRVDEDSLTDVRNGMQTVQAALADLKRIDIEVELDEDALLAELDRLRDLEIGLPMKLKVDESSVASLKAAVAAIDAELSRQAEIEIEVNLDEDSLLDARAKYMAQITAMEAQAKAVAEAQKRMARESELAAKKAAKQAEESAANFQKMGKNVGSALSRITGLRLVYGIFEHFGDFFKNLDKKLPLIGSLALAMAGLGGVALDAAGGIFALARALAQIGPGALALPGILGGIAVGVGATVAVFRDFNKVLPGVQKELSAIQDSMSEKFWAVAKQPISDMIDNLLPKFRTGLEATSVALGGFFGALADSLSQSFSGDAIANMFADLNKSIKIFTGYTDSIAEIIRILGEAGAGRLPDLAEWVGKLTERFANFLKANEGATMDGWIDTAIERVHSLWDALSAIATTLWGLGEAADAASSGDGLTNFANTMQKISDTVNNDQWQAKLTAVLQAADQMMQNISAGSGAAFMAFWDTFSTTLTKILPKAGDAIGTLLGGVYKMLGSAPVQNGLVTLFEGLKKGAEDFAPAFEVLGPKMGATLTLLGAAFSQIGGILAAVIEAVAPVAQAIMETLTPVIERVGPLVKQIFTDLQPVFATVADNATKLKEPLLGLVDSFQNLWNVVGPLLIPVLSIIVGILGGAVRGVITGVSLALEGITQVISGVVNVFKGFGNIFMGIVDAISGNGLGRLKTGFGQVFGGLKDIVVGALKAVAGALWAWLNGTLLGFVRGGLVKLLTAWKGGWKGLLNLAKSVWNGIKTAVVTAFNFVKGAIGRILGGIKSVWSGGWNGIKSVASTVWNAIKSAVSTAINAVKNTITNIVNGIKTFWSGGWNGIKTTLSNAWTNMVNKVTEMVGKVISKAKEIIPKVKSALGNLGSTLKASGMALIQGFIDGISDKFDAAKNIVSNGLSKLRNLFPFSPAKEGPFSGTGYTSYSGRALMEDFGKGMLDGVPLAKKAAEDATKEVKDAQKKADDRAKKAAIRRWKALGSDLVAATKQGMLQNLPGIKSLANQIVKDIPDKVSKKMEKRLRSQAASMAEKVQSLTDVMNEIDSKIKEIKDAAEDFAATAVKAMTDLGNPSSLGALELETPEVTFDQIVENYDKAIERATAFSDVINKLAGMGLNDATLQQLIEAGPEAGYAAAKAIADSGAEGVATVNQLAGDLADSAGSISQTAYDSMYRVGRDAAEGILKGLRDQRDVLVGEITDLAEAMQKAMRKALKIKSPSRVFRELGGHTGAGFVLGIRDYHDRAEKAINELGSGRPKPPSLSRAALAGAGSVTNNRTVNYYAAPGTPQLNGEESLFAALDRARSNGF